MDKSWVQNGKPHYVAFQPREDDIDGLSLFFEKKEAGKRFERPIFGFLDVNVGIVRTVEKDDITLDVIQDEDAHALIIGIPNFHLMPETTPEEIKERKRVKKHISNFLASEIIDKKAAIINKYVEEGFSPKELL